VDRNTLLAIALSMAVYSLWIFYQATQEPPPVSPDAARQVEQPIAEPQRRDSLAADDAIGEPRQIPLAPTPDGPAETAPQVEPWARVFEGPAFEAELTNRGGAISRWTLRHFSQLDSTGREGAPIELVGHAEEIPGALATPFSDLGFGDLSSEVYVVESSSENSAVLVLSRGGVEIRKTYEFDLDGYGVELFIEVRNGTNASVRSDFSIRFPAFVRQGNDYTEESLIALHASDVEKELVGSVGVPGFFDGFFGGNGEEEIWRDVAWAGVDLKYFASLLLPEPVEGTRASFEALEPGQSAEAILRFAPAEIAPGQSLRRHVTAFLGPKEPQLLETMGRELNKSVDLGYSWFEPLTLFFRWLLDACYRIVPNYGWSIILITILVRVLTLPIMNRQMRSMERMRVLQPRLKEIQAQFPDDRQKQSEATMALYRESGVNPLGGCFPMLLQFPVFIGLFFALQSSFALRQAPFLLWINDLSAPEALFIIPGLDLPFRVLPLVMGASMILQQKLTPTTVDPSQQMMMMVMMPIMMTVLFYQFPSGLVLYWMVSNFLGIAHQMLIGRTMSPAKT
jgi:YidC/Oxa1 family membrane protein insertase